MRKMKNYLKTGILLLGITILFWNCQENEIVIAETSNQPILNEKMEVISPNQLPKELYNQLTKYFNSKNPDILKKNSLEQIFQTYFESNGSKITSNDGIVTYALPFKKNFSFDKILKIYNSNTFHREPIEPTSTNCDKIMYEVLVINENTYNSTMEDPFGECGTIAFSTNGPAIGSTTTNIQNGNSFDNGWMYIANIPNSSSGNTASSTSSGNIFSTIWNSIKNFFNNLFNTRKETGGCLTSNKPSKSSKSSNNVVECYSNSSENNMSNSIEYNFIFPLPNELFDNVTNDIDCDCLVESIDEVNGYNNLNEDLKNQYFDCACANDNIESMSNYLELNTLQSDWYKKEVNSTYREEICSFIKINKHSTEAKNIANALIELEKILDNEFIIKSTNKLPLEISNCCPGDCCETIDMLAYDPIIYEYGIQPIQSAVDGTFNLLVASLDIIGSDERVGRTVRRMMIEIGIEVPEDVDNRYLSEVYQIRKRDGIVIVEYRPGILKSMLAVGLDTLDVLSFLSPSKGGGAFLAIKGGGKITITSLTNHIRNITITSTKITDVINNLKPKAKYILKGTGEFKFVAGHHPLAKIAFKSDKFYDLQKAFSVSKAKLDEVSGITDIHFQITGQQNSLYSAFAKTNKVLTLEKMAEIEIKAMTNVGIPEDIATGWVIKALEDLKNQGVKMITNIPWNGLN